MLLLDTCALVWLTVDPGRLPTAVRQQIDAEALFVSSISAWEVGLKQGSGKLILPDPAAIWFYASVEYHGVKELPVSGSIALSAAELPRLHNDPADRFIIATALKHDLSVVTPDKHIQQYPGLRFLW